MTPSLVIASAVVTVSLPQKYVAVTVLSPMINSSPAPPQLAPVINKSLGDISEPMKISRCQREMANRLAASFLACLENVKNDLDMANSTISDSCKEVTWEGGENARLQAVLSRLSFELASARTQQVELNSYRQRLADGTAEVDVFLVC